MRLEGSAKTRLCVQYDDHPRLMCTVLCSLMEHQSLVDLAIRCGNNTMHAHKCILAASSPYFREQLEKHPATEQVLINGLDFATMKSVIEFIYCGETNILEENLKYVVAAAKLFQIRGLQALASEAHFESDEPVYIPPPLFINNKPKYSSAYTPFNQNQNNPETPGNIPGPDVTVSPYNDNKPEPSFIEEVDAVPFDVFSDMNNRPQLISTPIIPIQCKTSNATILPFELPCDGTENGAGSLQTAFEDLQTDVEIMYKTPEGEYVQVSDAVIQRFNETCEDFSQFHFVDENGTARSVQRSKPKFDAFEQFVEDTFVNVPIGNENIDLNAMLIDMPGPSMPLIEEDISTPSIPDVCQMPDLTKQSFVSPIRENVISTPLLNGINSIEFYDRNLYRDIENEDYVSNFAACQQSEESLDDNMFEEPCLIIDEMPELTEQKDEFPVDESFSE